MPNITLNIRSWAGWMGGAPQPDSSAPPLLRRRVTPVGQTALGLAWSMPDGEKARYVFSSRHGEFERTLSLLKSVIHGEDLSPADFTLSVHHALTSLLSIAQRNTRGHNAISAGADSFCFGLIEAAACLAENPAEPVLFIHCDDAMPAPYDHFAEAAEQPVALALMLTAGTDAAFAVTQDWRAQTGEVATNHAAQFLNFLSGGENSAHSHGPETYWQWTRHALA